MGGGVVLMGGGGPEERGRPRAGDRSPRGRIAGTLNVYFDGTKQSVKD